MTDWAAFEHGLRGDIAAAVTTKELEGVYSKSRTILENAKSRYSLWYNSMIDAFKVRKGEINGV